MPAATGRTYSFHPCHMTDRTAIMLQKESPLNLTLSHFRGMEVLYSKRPTRRRALSLFLKELRYFLKRRPLIRF
jgi:hypothetical protein